MRRNLFVVVGALALAVGAVMLFTGFGLAQANPPAAEGPNPLVDVDTTIDAADATDASGTIEVCNVSTDSTMTMTIQTVAVKLFYKEGRGDWMDLAEVSVSDFPTGPVSAEGCVYDIPWEAAYGPLEGATRISIEAQVTVDERPDDKVFIARDCVDFPYP